MNFKASVCVSKFMFWNYCSKPYWKPKLEPNSKENDQKMFGVKVKQNSKHNTLGNQVCTSIHYSLLTLKYSANNVYMEMYAVNSVYMPMYTLLSAYMSMYTLFTVYFEVCIK